MLRPLSLASKSPQSTIPILSKPSTTPQTQTCLPRSRPSLKVSSTSSSSNSSDAPPAPPPKITPPDTVEIRFRRGSRRRMRQMEGRDGQPSVKTTQASNPPKTWEEMSLTEKALELYVGEKGMLFWLNKFAYTSIFIIIGGWILFRFVGPSLNLYQLDSSPLSPSSMFKGS